MMDDYRERVGAPRDRATTPSREGPYFEDFQVGFELTLKKPPITRLQIAKFAGASGDFNPSHVDGDIAREMGKMGDVFAHGMLGMGFIGQMLTDWLWDRPLRMFSARAVLIVRPGDALTCFGKVMRKWVEDEDNLAELEVGARNQNGDLTHTGRAVALFPHRPLRIRDELKRPYLVQHRVIG